MIDSSKNIIENNINNVSRNAPLALVVGAAGFIGSFICEALLKKEIQVIGADNFSSGKKENLLASVKNKRFHFININASDLNLDVLRLDYVFIVAGAEWDMSKVLEVARSLRSKVVFISDIGLYERNVAPFLSWLKVSEEKIAGFAAENNLNARIVRIGSVFGPRMNFKREDPIVRLIQATLLGEIQKESTALEFSTRALYISDAVDLIVKSMLSGSTAQKIFDGINEPVKISEIKQILMDPLWHETRKFVPSELPPWVTPNFENTKKHLYWKPEMNIVLALRNTLQYFKETETQIPGVEVLNFAPFKIPEVTVRDTAEFKQKVNKWKEDIGGNISIDIKKRRNFLSKGNLTFLFFIIIIILGIIYPAVVFFWNGFLFRQNILLAESRLIRGEIGASIVNIDEAKKNLEFINGLVGTLELPFQAGILSKKLIISKRYLLYYSETLSSVKKSITGANSLYDSFKTISGEKEVPLKDQVSDASAELKAAYFALSEVALNLQRNNLKGLPFINLDFYLKLTYQNKELANILPLVAVSDKRYLILLKNDKELVGSGGKILVASRIDFENGKLKQIETKTVNFIDEKLRISTNPQQILKEDLNIQKGGLQYSNFDVDFPTSARLASWFYNKSSGKAVDGVISLDVSSLEKLLKIIGQVELENSGRFIDEKNLRDFLDNDNEHKLTVVFLDKFWNKIFFVPEMNWPQIVNWFSTEVLSKNIQIYFEDKRIFSKLLAEGISGSMSRPYKDQSDLLAFFETAVGKEKSNIYLDRRIDLATKLDNQGNVSHSLKVGYTNANEKNMSNKIRMRIYLPAGSKVIKAFFGESDLMKNSTSTIEYGRLAYAFVFEIKPKEQMSLNFEYLTPAKLNLQSDKINYRLDIIKQSGTLPEPFEWRINYPEGLKTRNQTNIVTDLRQDRSFAVTFTK